MYIMYFRTADMCRSGKAIIVEWSILSTDHKRSVRHVIALNAVRVLRDVIASGHRGSGYDDETWCNISYFILYNYRIHYIDMYISLGEQIQMCLN